MGNYIAIYTGCCTMHALVLPKLTYLSLLRREGLPTFEPVKLHVDDLIKEGRLLTPEQDAVNRLKLSDEYMKNTGKKGRSLIGLSG